MTAVRLLLTGFEPFGGSSVNPSMKVAQALDGKMIHGCQVRSEILPVEGGRMPPAILAALDEIKPAAVLGLGEAPRRAVVSIERVALNLQDYSIPDNSGMQRSDVAVREGAPAAYFSTLPVRGMYTALKAAGIPAELSLTAGAYLCNHLMFTLLDHFATQGLPIPAGFVHLPSLPEQVIDKNPPGPSMALETSIKAVSTAIEVIVNHIQD